MVRSRGPRAPEPPDRGTPGPSADPLWGYLGQLVAGAGWSSLPWLHRIRTPTLVLTGEADTIVPPINARILA
ncbi:MAG TPA: hypothetical protein VFH30_00115, partial [Acidimicrobiales bacterium]|nr:hypothetical protein [Acidimicrobiales bacterium]